jgi:hypothetical protein
MKRIGRNIERLRTEGRWAVPFALLIAAVAIIVVLHPLRPDVSLTHHYISEYGNEAWSWLLSGALLAVALGLLALGRALREATRVRLTPQLLWASGGMLLLAAVFSTDRRGGEVEAATLAGQLHGILAIGAFCLLVLAMIALPLRSSDAVRELGRAAAWALPLAAAATTIAALAYAVAPDAGGIRQRMFLLVVFGWLIATTLQLRFVRGKPELAEVAETEAEVEAPGPPRPGI